MKVPVIDISPFLDPAAKAAQRDAVAREWDHALRTMGFASIVGHGVPQDLLDRVREAALAFFDLPLEEKRKCSFPGSKESQGYFQVGAETVSKTFTASGDATPPDLVETLTFAFVDWETTGTRSDFERSIFRPNRWPTHPAGASDTIREYYWAVHRVARSLMRLSAAALRLPDSYFDKYYERIATSLRLAHYPPQETPPREGQMRYGPHTDYMGFTILLQDERHGGLEVLDPQEQWVPVEPMRGAFTVNVGDLLSRWTNLHWKSNIHRVVNPPPEAASHRRLSVVLFTGPDYESEIACIPTCQSPDDPPRFAPIQCWDHFQEKVRASLS